MCNIIQQLIDTLAAHVVYQLTKVLLDGRKVKESYVSAFEFRMKADLFYTPFPERKCQTNRSSILPLPNWRSETSHLGYSGCPLERLLHFSILALCSYNGNKNKRTINNCEHHCMNSSEVWAYFAGEFTTDLKHSPSNFANTTILFFVSWSIICIHSASVTFLILSGRTVSLSFYINEQK